MEKKKKQCMELQYIDPWMDAVLAHHVPLAEIDSS